MDIPAIILGEIILTHFTVVIVFMTRIIGPLCMAASLLFVACVVGVTRL